MRVKILKNIKHSLLVEEADLVHIFEFLKRKYEKAKIAASCTDGTRLESDGVDDILKFNNPSYRKIKTIEIDASDTYEERISLKLGGDNFEFFDNVAEFTINSENDESARDRTQELLKMFSDMRPYYDLIARVSLFGLVIILWAVIGLSFSAGQIFGLLPKSDIKLSAVESLNYTVIFLLIIFLISYPLDRFRKWIFPRVFINLGNQKREMAKIKQWRDTIFKTILLGIIIGIIVYFITKPF